MYGQHSSVTADSLPEKEDSPNAWDGNLYSYHFVDKDQETENKAAKVAKAAKKAKANDWDGNLYSYHFVDKDQETENKAAKVAKKAAGQGANGWDGNLYSYHFVDKDQETEDKAAKVAEMAAGQGSNGWDGNLYSYHFVDKDQETENIAQKLQDKANGKSEVNCCPTLNHLTTVSNVSYVSYQYLSEGDGKSVKPLPHLNGEKDWETWKANMLTMRPHMKEYSKILALYMHCMLQ